MDAERRMDEDDRSESDDGCSGDESELAEYMLIFSGLTCDTGIANGYPASQDHLAIKGLECHFNWIQSALTHLRAPDFSRIQKTNEMWIEDTKDDSTLVYYKILTQNMIKALGAYLKGSYDEALDLLNKALVDLRIADARDGGFPPCHSATYEWIINANRLVVLNKQGDMPSPDALALKKGVLEHDCDYPPTAALILVVKAAHLRWFGKDESQTKELLEQALRLDPDVPAYMLELYGFLRRVRRDDDFLSGPTKREESLVYRARDLAPDSPIVLKYLCTFYQDALKAYASGNYQGECQIVEEMGVGGLVQEMISRAKEAADARPESVGTSIRYAEVLTYGKTGRKDDTANWKEAREQFSYCLEKWPQNSEVLHKIGKLAVYMDFPTGIDYFKRALKSSPENFPCLMDFIRASYRKDKDRCVGDLIDYLDIHADTLILRPTLLKKIQLLKGSLLLREKKLEAAVNCWIVGLGEPQTVGNIPRDAVQLMLGSRMLDACDRYQQLTSLVRFLELEIPKTEESSYIRSLVAMKEFLKMEFSKQKKRLHPCDADDSWRSSSGPLKTAQPVFNENAYFQGKTEWSLGPCRPPRNLENWRQRPNSAAGSSLGNVSTCSSGFGSGSDLSGNGQRTLQERNSSRSERGPNVPEYRQETNGYHRRCDVRIPRGDGRSGGRSWTPSVSDADDNWRRRK